MAEIIRMPLLSDTMKEGKIAVWLKKVGDLVKGDDVLAEVETDKATMEVIGYAEGSLLHIGVEAGKAAQVNEIIAIIGKPGEDISEYLNKDIATPPPPATADTKASNSPTTASNAPLPKELIVITMPLLSDTMKEGKIASWIKNIGDSVNEDDVIAEVETDKATMEVIGYAKGTLLYIGAEAGNAVPVNGTLAVVGPSGYDIAPYIQQLQQSGNVSTEIEIKQEVVTEASVTTPSQASISIDVNDSRVKASPLAKKVAKEKGIALQQVSGTGEGGRIILRDISNYSPGASSASATPSVTHVSGVEGFTDTPTTQMRQIIAQRLSESKFSAPHFYLKTSVSLDALLELRKQINASQEVKVSINDMIIKAAALSLKKHPEVNSSWLGDKVRSYHHVHIGSAIALPDGLIVPVIKHADMKSIVQIAQDANVLYDKARNKKIQPSEFTGNTFTISNLGMMDIDEFTAIINPPDACILAVGKGTPTPVVAEDGNIVIKTIMKLTLSCDHRVVDGAVGASFLKTLKGYLENPIGMFL
jgi:pyruvate dehydrogenase E2 component (dihydrolipoamide acetyltransferase)